ncbi:MAG: polysaccharide deacetylase family protein, partial [Gemmatimonadales bacterium]
MKSYIERIAHRSGITSLLRRRQTGALVLAYHNVVSNGLTPTGDRSLHLARSDFAAQLELLGETCELVALDALLDEPRSRTVGRPAVAITFDDGYRGALENGVAELEKRRTPATFFVAPGRLDGHAFWWDRLAAPVGGLEPSDRN